jgi:hypothetical protein
LTWIGVDYEVDIYTALMSLEKTSNYTSTGRVAQCLYFAHPSRMEVLEGNYKGKGPRKSQAMPRLQLCYFCGLPFKEPRYRANTPVEACLPCVDKHVKLASPRVIREGRDKLDFFQTTMLRLAEKDLPLDLYESQGGRCSSCGSQDPGWKKSWPIRDGKLLCIKCFRGLGRSEGKEKE